MIDLYDLDADEVADLVVTAQSNFIREQLGLSPARKRSGRSHRK
jgi:hypothetical protein